MYVVTPSFMVVRADHSCFTHIAKALEMFLGMIVEEASKVTTDRGSKKLEAYHLYVSFCYTT